MSHSNIYQISRKPIDKDDYKTSSEYYDNSSDFADYIGDELEGELRDKAISELAELIKDVFEYIGDGVFVYRGKRFMQGFKQDWADEIKHLAEEMTADNMTKNQRLYNIGQTTLETHLRSDCRVDLVDWCNGVANPLGELFEFADYKLRKGCKLYVGAVIDYHL